MISTRDLVFGATLLLATLVGGFIGSCLGGLTHLVWGACAAGGLVYLVWSLLGRF